MGVYSIFMMSAGLLAWLYRKMDGAENKAGVLEQEMRGESPELISLGPSLVPSASAGTEITSKKNKPGLENMPQTQEVKLWHALLCAALRFIWFMCSHSWTISSFVLLQFVRTEVSLF